MSDITRPYTYCKVKLLYAGVNLSFSYKTTSHVFLGQLAYVPLKKKYVWGIIILIWTGPDDESIKAIYSLFSLPLNYKKFLHMVSRYLCLEIVCLYKKISLQLTSYTIDKKNCDLSIVEKSSFAVNTDFVLSESQKEVVQSILHSDERTYLLHGVTGSGKTYIYISLIKSFLEESKTVIFLFPNVILASTMYQKVLPYLLSHNCFEYHSGTPHFQREIIWQAILQKKSCVVFGVHIPLFLPFSQIDLIIVDEEHDSSYVENRFPYINHKDAALIRAASEKCKIVLGSATPSVSSYYNAINKKYRYCYLKTRYENKALPLISFRVLNEDEKKIGISGLLREEIDYCLEKGEQVILYLNRKGLCHYARCKHCDYVFFCKNCSTRLTVFSHNIGKCGRCSYQEVLSDTCPDCGKKKEIIMIGKGLQKISKNIASLYPYKKVVEIDGDIFKNKVFAREIIKNIEKKEYDIILGTHIITKGYTFDSVSLVGVLNVDQYFSIPHFMTMEEVVRQCIQASGRAGRKHTEGKVVLQSFQDISSFVKYFSEEGYVLFLNDELDFRKKFKLPPFYKLSSVIIKNKDEVTALHMAKKIHEEMNDFNKYFCSGQIIIQPPQKSFYFKVKKIFYYEIIIKATTWEPLLKLVEHVFQINTLLKKEILYIPSPMMTFYE
jgi:primosomal protein N' (replication factor Y)